MKMLDDTCSKKKSSNCKPKGKLLQKKSRPSDDAPKIVVSESTGLKSLLLRDMSGLEAAAEYFEQATLVRRVELIKLCDAPGDVRSGILAQLSRLDGKTDFQLGVAVSRSLSEVWLGQVRSLTTDAHQHAWLDGAVAIAAYGDPTAIDAAAHRIYSTAKAQKMYTPTVKMLAEQIRKVAGLPSPNGRVTAVKVSNEFAVAMVPPTAGDDETVPHVVHDQVDWFVYRDGAWGRKSTEQMETLISKFIGDCYPDKLTAPFVRDVLLALRSHCQISPPQNGDAMHFGDYGEGWEPVRALGCANGVLVLDDLLDGSGEVRHVPPSPRYFTPNTLPVEFDDAAEAPRFEQFLDETLPVHKDGDRRVQILQQLAGYCLAGGHLRLERFFVLHGRGSNGKSVFLETLTAMLGSDNVSHLCLDQIGERFNAHLLVGKLANIATDLSEIDKVDEGRLKRLASFEPIVADRKYQSAMSVRVTAPQIFAANAVPYIRDNSEGTIRRMTIVPFLERFEGNQVDIKLIDKLIQELPGILNWALDGLKQLAADGRFADCQVCEAAKQRYRSDCDTVLAFIEDRCLLRPKASTEAKDVYASYREWCELNGRSALNQVRLRQRLEAFGVSESRPQNKMLAGRRPRIWKGIKLPYLP